MKCCAGGNVHPSLVCGSASGQGRFVTAAAEAPRWIPERRCQTEGKEPPGTGQDCASAARHQQHLSDQSQGEAWHLTGLIPSVTKELVAAGLSTFTGRNTA